MSGGKIERGDCYRAVISFHRRISAGGQRLGRRQQPPARRFQGAGRFLINAIALNGTGGYRSMKEREKV
jgi:hypothetical protein